MMFKRGITLWSINFLGDGLINKTTSINMPITTSNKVQVPARGYLLCLGAIQTLFIILLKCLCSSFYKPDQVCPEFLIRYQSQIFDYLLFFLCKPFLVV